ncbi:Methionine synthase [subsurface metagenome]
MDTLQAITENLKKGQAAKVKELTQAALDEGISPDDVLDNGLIAGMTVVGKLFKENEVFLPEVMMSAKAMDAGMSVLEPLLLKSGKHESKGKVALGTVQGDVHSIGKNLVGIVLKGAGFEVTDLGVNTPTQKFVDAAQNGAQIIGMSALLTTTMQHMQPVIDALEKAGLKGRVKTMIGGCIVTQEYADSIGADGYAPDAGSAVDKAKELMGLA